MTTLQTPLSEEWNQYINELLSQGRFHSVQDVIEAALEKYRHEEANARLIKLLEEGERSPKIHDYDPVQHIAEMKEEYEAKRRCAV